MLEKTKIEKESYKSSEYEKKKYQKLQEVEEFEYFIFESPKFRVSRSYLGLLL